MPRHLARRDSRGVLLVQPRIDENDPSSPDPVISHRRRKYSTVGLPYTHQRDYYARLNARRQSHSQQSPTDLPSLSPPHTKRRPSIRTIRRRSSHNPRVPRYVVRETSSDIEIDAFLASDDADDMDADEAAQWATSFTFPAPRRRKSDNIDSIGDMAEDSDQRATTITPVSATFSFSSSDADGGRTLASSVGPFDGVECTWGTPLSSPQPEEDHAWHSSLPAVGKFASQQSFTIPAESADEHMKNATAERRHQTLAALHQHIAQLSAALRVTTNKLEVSIIGLHVALDRNAAPSSEDSDSEEDETPRSPPQPSDTSSLSSAPSTPLNRTPSALMDGARERLRAVEFETGKTLALVALLAEDVARFHHLE